MKEYTRIRQQHVTGLEQLLSTLRVVTHIYQPWEALSPGPPVGKTACLPYQKKPGDYLVSSLESTHYGRGGTWLGQSRLTTLKVRGHLGSWVFQPLISEQLPALFPPLSVPFSSAGAALDQTAPPSGPPFLFFWDLRAVWTRFHLSTLGGETLFSSKPCHVTGWLRSRGSGNWNGLATVPLLMNVIAQPTAHVSWQQDWFQLYTPCCK